MLVLHLLPIEPFGDSECGFRHSGLVWGSGFYDQLVVGNYFSLNLIDGGIVSNLEQLFLLKSSTLSEIFLLVLLIGCETLLFMNTC